MVSAITRFYIRARILKQWAIEDAFIILAVVCLCATTALNFATLRHLYDSLDVILQGFGSELIFTVLEEVSATAKKSDAMATLWWLVLFPVKLAYLFFFRKLIRRLRYLNIWWWCVIAFMIPAAIGCFVTTYIACPANDVQGVLQKCSGPSAGNRQVHVVAATTAIDVVTDVMVVSFPVLLLWKVKINLRQKLGLGTVLCLSLVMAIVAITRIGGVRLPSRDIDIVWLAFWQQQECSIALTMVSVNAFRSLFVANSSSPGRRSPAGNPKFSPSYWQEKRRHRQKLSDESDMHNLGNLPTIPSATLTGMRTMIGGSRWDRRDEDVPMLTEKRHSVEMTQGVQAEHMKEDDSYVPPVPKMVHTVQIIHDPESQHMTWV